jgi:hypothetical protein
LIIGAVIGGIKVLAYFLANLSDLGDRLADPEMVKTHMMYKEPPGAA